MNDNSKMFFLKSCNTLKRIIWTNSCFGQNGKGHKSFYFHFYANWIALYPFSIVFAFDNVGFILLIDYAKVIARSKYLSTEANWQKTIERKCYDDTSAILC